MLVYFNFSTSSREFQLETRQTKLPLLGQLLSSIYAAKFCANRKQVNGEKGQSRAVRSSLVPCLRTVLVKESLEKEQKVVSRGSDSVFHQAADSADFCLLLL